MHRPHFISVFFVFFVVHPSDHHTFTFGLGVRLSLQRPSFLSLSLGEWAEVSIQRTYFLSSLSTHFHFWFGFNTVTDIGAGLHGSGTRDWLPSSFSIPGTLCSHKAFELHLRETSA